MQPRLSLIPAVPVLLLALSCKGGDDKDTATPVNDPPRLRHEPPTGEFVAGSALSLEATASDPDGVVEVLVFFRNEGASYWDNVPLELSGDDPNAWAGSLETLYSPGLQYYLRATDRLGATTELPAEGQAAPFTLSVRPASLPLPFLEDFELSEGTSSVAAMGWLTPSDGFSYYQWSLSSRRSAGDGGSSAFHDRGSPSGDEIRDWLISPPLDFSGQEGVMVSWQESGAAVTESEAHGLYISTTTADPSAFSPVEAALPLPPEDGSWAPSAVYDLSAWAGEPTVYLAWFYQGTYADDWYVDEVLVEPLTAVLDLSFDYSPKPVWPGETVTLTWTLDNAIDAPSEPLTATLSLPDGGGTPESWTQEVSPVPGLGSGVVSFEVPLDPDIEPNRYYGAELELTDGLHTWNASDRFVVGYSAQVNLSVAFDEPAGVEILVGVGDPNAPTLELPVAVGFVDAGPLSFVLDITEYDDLLPPAAGPLRWYARLRSDRTGEFTSFSIDAAGGSQSANLPLPVAVDEDLLVFLPAPAEPILLGASPSTTSPGAADLPLSFTLQNVGEASSGPVSARVVSVDADGVVTGGEGLSLGPDIWAPGEVRVLSGPTLTVDPTHTDSSGIRLQVELDDGIDSWVVPAEVDVPWPVIRTIYTSIRDSSSDGMLDPGESANLELVVANSGGLATDGRIDVSLSVNPASPSTATIVDGTDSTSALGIGGEGSLDFEISDIVGAHGSPLILDLTITDNSRTYFSSTSIILGEAPWQAFSAIDDARGDSLSGGFDLARGEYRVMGDEMQVRIYGHAPYDPAAVFLESWGYSAGAPYQYYRWVLQAGTLRFQGYESGLGWTTIGTGTTDLSNPDYIQMNWSISDMDLLLSDLAFGWAEGWCGPPDYYCDQYPDAWGYPYDSFTTAGWFNLSW